MDETRKLANNWNLICYCGKATTLYDGLFERNFCSSECATNLLHFFGSIEQAQSIVKKASIAGEFKIEGTIVTLLRDREKATNVMQRIESTVDKIVETSNAETEHRKKLKKMGLDDATIEAMLIAMKTEIKP